MTFAELEKKLNKKNLLTCPYKDKESRHNGTLREFLIWFFDNMPATATKSGERVDAKHRRSVVDIYRLCKYYFPKTKLEEVYKTLDLLIKDGYLRKWRCHVLKKIVYMNKGRWFSSYEGNSYSADEYGVTQSQIDKL